MVARRLDGSVFVWHIDAWVHSQLQNLTFVTYWARVVAVVPVDTVFQVGFSYVCVGSSIACNQHHVWCIMVLGQSHPTYV